MARLNPTKILMYVVMFVGIALVGMNFSGGGSTLVLVGAGLAVIGFCGGKCTPAFVPE